MKKAIIAMLAAGTLMYSCTETEQFNADYTADIYISDTIGSFYDFELVDSIDSRFLEITGDNYVNPENIEKIVLRNLNMTITDTASDEVFADLRDIEVFVSAEGTPEVKVAYSYFNGADDLKYLDFKINAQNVASVFSNEKVAVKIRTRKRDIYLGDFPLHIEFSVMFEATK